MKSTPYKVAWTNQSNSILRGMIKRYLGFVLLILALSSGASHAYCQTRGIAECPSVLVSCPSRVGSPTIIFYAAVTGAPSNEHSFKWSVTNGRIISGQGTGSIRVDASGSESQTITATVEIIGFPKECSNKDSCSTGFISDPPAARKFDEYGDLSVADERRRLDEFAVQLRRSHPRALRLRRTHRHKHRAYFKGS